MSAKEQLSDLVIVHRVVRELTRDRPLAESDRELLEGLDRGIRSLVERVAEVVHPEKYDRDEDGVLSEPEKRELVARFADAVSSRPAGAPLPVSGSDHSLEGTSALALRVAEMHAMLDRIARDVKSLGAVGQQAASLRGDMERLAEVFAEREERGRQAESASGYRDDEQLEEEEWEEEPSWATQPRTRVDRPQPISSEEARERLITLRRRIWED